MWRSYASCILIKMEGTGYPLPKNAGDSAFIRKDKNPVWQTVCKYLPVSQG